jgi:hypothetical protein
MAIVLRLLSLPLLTLAMFAGEPRRCASGEHVALSDSEWKVEDSARAAIAIEGPCRITIKGVRVHGQRGRYAQPQPLPAYNELFADHYSANGIWIRGAAEVVIEDSEFDEIAGFAILISGAERVRISRCHFRNSGSRNANGRNNTTGGVLLEDGTANFVVEQSEFKDILGNGVWTHSRYRARRNGPGVIRGNRFDGIARDAIQVGHAFGVAVLENTIHRVGYPVDAVDVEGGGTPVGIDTAGDVDSSEYARNRMSEINGKCIDLDGFHHGSVQSNTCKNQGQTEIYPFSHFGIVMNNTNPDMQSVAIRLESNEIEGMRFGGIFIIGSGHVVRNNRLRRLYLSHCSDDVVQPGCTHFEGEPDLLRSGIYLGRRAERPAITRGNTIAGNEITGWRMDRRCIGAAPGVAAKENRIAGNVCRHNAE